ncbi:MAG: serine/threonine-protein kinase, partial [Myxococcota bacterium]
MDPAMMASGSPTRLGRYVLHEALGVGGMATVYRGELQAIAGFRRAVAVKVLHPHLRTDPKVVRGFLREARLAARLRHTNVVPVLDVGEVPEGVFLVMELCDGVTLGELLAASAGGTRAALGLHALTEALAGLHEAHELRGDDGASLGLVHRDFTVNNILADRRGAVRLADFGIARTSRGPIVTTQPVVKGTLPYLAPEQVRGAELDRRTDVFAAGSVAFEVLTGRPLQDPAAEPTLTLARIAAGEHASTRELAPGAPDALHDAIEWALRLDPAERCPDADALRRAILDATGPSATGRAAVAAAVERALEAQQSDGAGPAAATRGPAARASVPESGQTPPRRTRV